MHKKNIVIAGKPLTEASKVLIMLHGRGATARDILAMANYLHVADYCLIAPQATNNTWYPYSFLAPPAQNEPWLSSAIDYIHDVVQEIVAAGTNKAQLYFMGFSQGACLTLEYVARHATKYGGVAAFTGGLIGDRIYSEKYKGAFDRTPVFIGSSNPDPHVPVERVKATTAILIKMGASVTEKIYDQMGHTINDEEIRLANELIFK